MDSQPFLRLLQPFGFAKRAGLCYPASFDFNLLYTVGRQTGVLTAKQCREGFRVLLESIYLKL